MNGKPPPRLCLTSPVEGFSPEPDGSAANLAATAEAARRRLEQWLRGNGWAGWDPFDYKGMDWHRWLQRGGSLRRRACSYVDLAFDLFPLELRRIARVRPMRNAKAMGLFLAGYAMLYPLSREPATLARALECADWLLRHRSTGFKGYSWGYPFDWRSVRFIPKGTPSCVVSSTVGDGFFQLYRTTGDDRYLQVCKEICRFFTTSLRLSYRADGVRCYSYTPIDDYRVHNANLLVAEFLTRIAAATGDAEWMTAGTEAGRYALSEQRPAGFLPYWSDSQRDTHSGGVTWIDSFHCGFEIRSLHGLWRNTGNPDFLDAARRYLRWYLNSLYTEEGMPKFQPDCLHPVDIHACAEALLCHAQLASEIPDVVSRLSVLLAFTTQLLETSPGAYGYRIRSVKSLYVRSDITMIRWGQAWMHRALAAVLAILSGGLDKPRCAAPIPPIAGPWRASAC